MKYHLPATDRQTLKIFWHAYTAYKTEALIALLFPIGAIIMTVVVPLIIGRIIAGLANPSANVASLIPYLAAASFLGVICNRYGARHHFSLQAKAMSDLQERAFTALMRRSTGFHGNNIGGKLVSDVVDYPSAFGTLMDAIGVNLLPLILILICGSTLVFIESWQLGLVVVAMSAYTVIATAWTTVRRSAVRRRRQAMTKKVTSHIADTIVNINTVKTFARERQEIAHYHDLSQQLANLRITDWGVGSGMANTRMAVLLVMQLGFIAVLIHVVRADPSVFDIGIFAFSFIATLSIRLIQLHPTMRQIEDGFLNAAPITKILGETPEIVDSPNAHDLQVDKAAIGFDRVHFRYDDAGKDSHVFRELSLAIQPGEKIGLVGPSGGGKSTLTRLLLRFEDINHGSITIDGQNIAEVTQSSLRTAVSYVPQEPLLFHRSIKENIAYGDSSASDEDIVHAARRAYAHEFITELSDGYDTIVGERGVKLSGGQRQRIAIARAILKNAPILVLDEATSALDSESEKLIQSALTELMKDKTAIVIAHRLSTIQQLDRIIVLDGGEITEEGTHKKLRAGGGLYAKLWAHQSGGFIED